MSRSWLGLTVLVAGYTIAVGVILAAAFLIHVILGFAAFFMICAGVGAALDSLLADDKPEEDGPASMEDAVRRGGA